MNRPIGVFDSGVGGLTVLRALRELLPARDYVYLGDTARLPYGTKSAETVARYAAQCADRLAHWNIDCLVVACNTASAAALESLRGRHPHLPVIGVIEPGARAAVAASRTGHIGVIGTESTIEGGAYTRALRALAPMTRVTAAACSLFVALAEEGWTDGAIAEAVARRYLEPMFAGSAAAPDTLVLGCTHFPTLAGVLRAVLPRDVLLVDSARTTAAAVQAELLLRQGSAVTSASAARGAVQWLATDNAARFARIGSRFLGESLSADQVHIIDL